MGPFILLVILHLLGVGAFIATVFFRSISSKFAKKRNPARDLESQFCSRHKATRRCYFTITVRRSVKVQGEYREPEFPEIELAQLPKPAIGPFMPDPPCVLETPAPGIAVPEEIANSGILAHHEPISELGVMVEHKPDAPNEKGSPGGDWNYVRIPHYPWSLNSNRF
ncbi:hypothetical protein L873DRAFT_1787157 [Choiromyces venosus 120613-1]|uniref:Uncharacterized protein n=1 Tax=Choiromyces venosus 120613-1 TaxID=1336337 RepID=A0A3N4K2E8_9PEZI|nr:hypothetical protein L873DRAFT_1787157 [Choiromyces venosus 120613-1]